MHKARHGKRVGLEGARPFSCPLVTPSPCKTFARLSGILSGRSSGFRPRVVSSCRRATYSRSAVLFEPHRVQIERPVSLFPKSTRSNSGELGDGLVFVSLLTTTKPRGADRAFELAMPSARRSMADFSRSGSLSGRHSWY